jgi:ribulose-5-phosphate 4-epimerase/fuculose-1-phosphate aldolase
VSARLPPWHERDRQPFLVSGTQTGGLRSTTAEHYALVQQCEVGANEVESEGPVAPSSEAMTHAALYAAEPRLRFVFHAHAAEIWSAARRLELPATPADVDYGTPKMAWAVEKLMPLRQTREQRAIAMLGHQDGVITFGETADEAGEGMVRLLARARSLTSRP